MTTERSGQPGLNCKDCWWRVLIILAVVGFILIASTSTWPWTESPWQVATAVATTAATGVALWLGLRETGWRREMLRTQRFQASLYMLSREEWIKDAANRLDVLIHCLPKKEADECFIVPKEISKQLGEIINLLDGINKEKIALVDAKSAFYLVKSIGVLQFLEHEQRGGRGFLIFRKGFQDARRDLDLVMRTMIWLNLRIRQAWSDSDPSVDKWR